MVSFNITNTANTIDLVVAYANYILTHQLLKRPPVLIPDRIADFCATNNSLVVFAPLHHLDSINPFHPAANFLELAGAQLV
ncbi:hypothetical protein NUW58_g10840 [Xylaria curta]|uniref:Uncharacterized protein n=1 Tax=Xylaria curta TaxID=42375 RepID=A0ACC1MHG7_9PEZI|nr:hypothetical protein NUW58_g10840 [Xylaria curta]